jgi:hypothetical protein
MDSMDEVNAEYHRDPGSRLGQVISSDKDDGPSFLDSPERLFGET